MNVNAVEKLFVLIKNLDMSFFDTMAIYNPYVSQKLETIKRLNKMLNKSQSRSSSDKT